VEHNPLAQPLPLLAERTFGQVGFDADLSAGHQLVYRAAIGYTVQFVALGVGQYALEGQFDVQGIFAFLLLAVIAFDLDRDTGQRDVFLFGVHLQGHGLAGAEGGVEVVMGFWRSAFAADIFGYIGKQFVLIDLDAVTKTFGGNGIDGNSHGKPRRLQENHSIKKDPEVIEHSCKFAFHFLALMNPRPCCGVYAVPTFRRSPVPLFRYSVACLLVFACHVASAREYAYSDAHLHYVDFFQETAGMPKLLKAMADNCIEHVMISGIPVAKKWHEDEPKRPRYYAGDDADAYWYSATDVIVAAAVNSLPPGQRQYFHPFLSGFNPNDKNSAAHIQRMLDLNPGLWQGIGEVFTRHDDLTALTSGDTPRANNEAMTRIYHLAAENDLPVMLHSNITSKREKNPLYLAEVEEPLRNHPHTRFIWAHAGTSAEIHRHQTRLDFLLPTLTRMLEAYPNLFVDLSWSMLTPYLLDEQGKPRGEWLKLVERFPERFMLGSDVVGRFNKLGKEMRGFDPFLDALPEDVARKVARDNFLAILPRSL